MTDKKKVYWKRLILFCTLALLSLPAIQARLNLPGVVGELEGYAEPVPHPELTWNALWANTYQHELERYIDNRIGFKTLLTKLRNEFAFTILHETNDPNLFVGPHNSLFDARTLYGYVGLDELASEDAVQRHIRRLRVVQDTLARRGKLLVFVAAASKASFAPENMPAYFRHLDRRQNNYEKYTAAMRAAGINLIDLSRAVRSWKDTASYPIFTWYGGHWSSYGAVLAGDTLMRYVQQKYGHPLRDYRLLAGDVDKVPRDNDNETEKVMNLLHALPAVNLRYPRVEYAALKPGQRQPNALIIGDSFVFTVLYTYFAQAFNDKLSRFWLRNVVAETTSWPSEVPEGKDARVLDRKAQYLNRDIILVMFTEYNLDKRLDYGFSDDAYKLFVPYTHADSLHLKALEEQIRQRPVVADYWWRKEIETGISQDQLIHQIAEARYDSIR
jgi:hypothetical protein